MRPKKSQADPYTAVAVIMVNVRMYELQARQAYFRRLGGAFARRESAAIDCQYAALKEMRETLKETGGLV